MLFWTVHDAQRGDTPNDWDWKWKRKQKWRSKMREKIISRAIFKNLNKWKEDVNINQNKSNPNKRIDHGMLYGVQFFSPSLSV